MLKNFLSYKSHVTRIGSNQVKQIPVSERVVIENTHEAIISSEDFEKAREVVKVTKAKSSSNGKNSILTGYLECGCCGGKLTKGKASNHNFLCVNARYRTDSGCRTVRIEEKRIQEILLNGLQCSSEWRSVRPIPEIDYFFENQWKAYRDREKV